MKEDATGHAQQVGAVGIQVERYRSVGRLVGRLEAAIIESLFSLPLTL